MKWRLALLFLLLAASSGCKHLRVGDRWFDTDRVVDIPSEILPIWTDTVLHQPNEPGVRGFGGRVYFYATGKPDPVLVDGQLAVYAFDGDAKDPKKVAPLRKYVITPDQLAGHHSSSSLGHSYSVWVPWDRVGGEGKTLSLVVRFDGRNGGTTLSKPSRMLLPGVEIEPEPFEMESRSGVQLASHEVEHKQAAKTKKLGFETTSIDLPPSFQRRVLSYREEPSLSHRESRELSSGEGESQAGAAAAKKNVKSTSPTADGFGNHSPTWEQQPLALPSKPASASDSAAVTPSWRPLSQSAVAARSRRPTRSAQQRLQARRKLAARQVPAADDRQPRPVESPFGPSMQLESDSTKKSGPDFPARVSADSPIETTRN